MACQNFVSSDRPVHNSTDAPCPRGKQENHEKETENWENHGSFESKSSINIFCFVKKMKKCIIPPDGEMVKVQ